MCVYIYNLAQWIYRDMKIAKWRIQSGLSELKPLKCLNNTLKGLCAYAQWLYTERCAIKSIFHGYMVWIEKSVSRGHCSASLVMPNSNPCDIIFYPHLIPMKDIIYIYISEPNHVAAKEALS